jgi:DNA ligase (NAD+)
MDIKKRIEVLSKFLSRCDERYFLYNESPIGDENYDLLKQELENLKKSINESIDSPIFSNLKNNIEKFSHEIPMLSLQKIYELKDVDDFFNKSNHNGIIMELKIDGISVSLIYKEGLLYQALTRGDGVIGEDITNNIFNIPTIPLMIKDSNLINKTIIIRGELYMKKSTHNNHFSHQIHPRNIAAGIIRKKYIDEDSKYIDFFGYNILNYNLLTQHDILQQLKDWNFPVENHYQLINDINNLHKNLDYWSHNIKNLDYECDGIVIKINDINLFNSLGNTISHPRGAVAFKFANKKKTTFLTDIQWQVGKNGRIIPVGIVNPIIIDGVSIKKVTLHNYDFVKNLNSTTIIIERAGGVIPKAIKLDIPDINCSDLKNIIKIPTNCPSCNNLLAITQKDLSCNNYQCPKQKLERLLHFCNTLKIYGIGEKIMEKLINNGIINNYGDILSCSKYSNGILDISIIIWTKFINQIKQLPKDYNLLKGITINYGGQKNLEKIIQLLKKNPYFIDYDYDNLLKFLIENGFTQGIAQLISKSLIIIKDDIKSILKFIDY